MLLNLNLSFSFPAPFRHSLFRSIQFVIASLLILCAPSALAQEKTPSPAHSGVPKYDRDTETKTKGVVEQINQLAWGSRKDFMELVVKNGDDKIHIYLCPKPFQDEMGITLAAGDEVSVTGSKVKQEESDVILAREVVKGQDTFALRDNKGNPVWDARTGK